MGDWEEDGKGRWEWRKGILGGGKDRETGSEVKKERLLTTRRIYT